MIDVEKVLMVLSLVDQFTKTRVHFLRSKQCFNVDTFIVFEYDYLRLCVEQKLNEINPSLCEDSLIDAVVQQVVSRCTGLDHNGEAIPPGAIIFETEETS